VEYAQVGVEKFIKLADQLGIEWLVVADNDSEGHKFLGMAKQRLNGRPESIHVHMLIHGDMEMFMCMEGYGYVFETNTSFQKKKNINALQGTDVYWRQVVDARSGDFTKPKAALTVIEEIEKKGIAGVPTQLRQIIESALKLALEVA
jgi:predicted ATP-dependent endonuclease of OLD family